MKSDKFSVEVYHPKSEIDISWLPEQLRVILRDLIIRNGMEVQFLFGKDKERPFKDCKFIVNSIRVPNDYAGHLGTSIDIIDATPSITFITASGGYHIMDLVKWVVKYYPEDKSYLSSTLSFYDKGDKDYRLTLLRCGAVIFNVRVNKQIDEMLESGEITEENLK